MGTVTRGPGQKLRSGTEVGPSTPGKHWSFGLGNGTPTARHDQRCGQCDAEQGHKELEIGQRFESKCGVKQVGWNESVDQDNRIDEPCAQSCMMESITTLVAEWLSFKEMKALQGVCVLTSVWAREWQFEDILSNVDDQVCRDLSDE